MDTFITLFKYNIDFSKKVVASLLLIFWSIESMNFDFFCIIIGTISFTDFPGWYKYEKDILLRKTYTLKFLELEILV